MSRLTMISIQHSVIKFASDLLWLVGVFSEYSSCPHQ